MESGREGTRTPRVGELFGRVRVSRDRKEPRFCLRRQNGSAAVARAAEPFSGEKREDGTWLRNASQSGSTDLWDRY